MRLRECDDTEAVAALLQQKGISHTATEKFTPPAGLIRAEHVFRPMPDHRRALAKIVISYLAHEYGRDVALEPRFDVVRDLVMRSIEPAYRYYAIDENPILEGDKRDGKRCFMHALLLKQRSDSVEVESIVNLFNRFRHGAPCWLSMSSGGIMIRHAVLPVVDVKPTEHARAYRRAA